jgi:hypothetical protein
MSNLFPDGSTSISTSIYEQKRQLSVVTFALLSIWISSNPQQQQQQQQQQQASKQVSTLAPAYNLVAPTTELVEQVFAPLLFPTKSKGKTLFLEEKTYIVGPQKSRVANTEMKSNAQLMMGLDYYSSKWIVWFVPKEQTSV